MNNDYLLNISIIEAIGVWNILKYLAVMVVELAACFFLVRHSPRLLKRLAIVVIVLFLLSLIPQTEPLYCIWFMVAVTVTGVFANTKWGFASGDAAPDKLIKIDPYLRNLLIWLLLVVVIYSLGIGSSTLSALARGPQSAEEEVWFIHHEKDGGAYLGFKEIPGNYIYVTKEFAPHFEKGDCVEVTFYSPYSLLENEESFATRIRSSDQCKGGN